MANSTIRIHDWLKGISDLKSGEAQPAYQPATGARTRLASRKRQFHSDLMEQHEDLQATPKANKRQ